MNRNHLSLWLLLLVAFCAVVCVSFFGPVNILGYELKDSGIAAALSRSEEVDMVVDSLIVPTDTVPAEPEPVPVDTASKHILFFGDSMLDGLYPRLAAYADKNGHELYVVIWYSSTSEVWGRSERLREYIDRYNPDYIFISLGANELFVKDIAEKRDKYVKKILADIGDIPYLWIGPPNWKPDTGINDLIEANVPKGNFFLSDGMEFRRKKDGAHPTVESAAEWMDSIARWMPLNSSHPILMETPDVARSRAKKVFVHQPNEN